MICARIKDQESSRYEDIGCLPGTRTAGFRTVETPSAGKQLTRHVHTATAAGVAHQVAHLKNTGGSRIVRIRNETTRQIVSQAGRQAHTQRKE